MKASTLNGIEKEFEAILKAAKYPVYAIPQTAVSLGAAVLRGLRKEALENPPNKEKS